jgi:hypothetical protein
MDPEEKIGTVIRKKREKLIGAKISRIAARVSEMV